MNNFQTKYLAEAGQRIRYAGFTVSPEKDGLLPVEWAGHRVCNVNGNGGMTYDPEHIRRNGLEDTLDRVREIVGETLSYMRQMETAPPLLAEGLSGDYRLLAEFNHIVLAGHAREGGYGVEFITWERIRNNTGLWQGHYYDNNYAAAKQDFTTRSGLLPASQLFTKEQLAVIYDAAQNMTALDLVSNSQQGKLLEELTLDELRDISPLFEEDVYEALRLETCMGQRSSYGGPAVAETTRQIQELRTFISACRP